MSYVKNLEYLLISLMWSNFRSNIYSQIAMPRLALLFLFCEKCPKIWLLENNEYTSSIVSLFLFILYSLFPMANAEQLNKLDHLDTKELSGKSKEQSEIKTDIDTKIADIAKSEPDASRSDLIKQVWNKFTDILRKDGVDMKQYQDWEIRQLFFAGLKTETLKMMNNDLLSKSLNHNKVLRALGNRIMANKETAKINKENWKDVWEWQVLDIKYTERLNQLTTAQNALKANPIYADKLAEIKPADTPKITALEAKYGMQPGELQKEFAKPNGKFDAYKKADTNFDFSQLLSFLQTNLVAQTDETVNRADFKDFEDKYRDMGFDLHPVKERL